MLSQSTWERDNHQYLQRIFFSVMEVADQLIFDLQYPSIIGEHQGLISAYPGTQYSQTESSDGDSKDDGVITDSMDRLSTKGMYYGTSAEI